MCPSQFSFLVFQITTVFWIKLSSSWGIAIATSYAVFHMWPMWCSMWYSCIVYANYANDGTLVCLIVNCSVARRHLSCQCCWFVKDELIRVLGPDIMKARLSNLAPCCLPTLSGSYTVHLFEPPMALGSRLARISPVLRTEFRVKAGHVWAVEQVVTVKDISFLFGCVMIECRNVTSCIKTTAGCICMLYSLI